MAKRTKPPAKRSRKDETVAVIKGYTESVERIGPDAALIGLIVTLGFGALAVGASTGGVLVLAAGAWGAWTVTKFINAHIAVRTEQVNLDKTRVERGQTILESHPDRQRQLQLPKREQTNDDD